MNSIAIGFIVFACCFGGALLGMFLSTRLPQRHLSAESKNIVTLGMGLVGTMTALVLGLLVASAFSHLGMPPSWFLCSCARSRLELRSS
jgi:hypothetical protein